MREKPWFRAKCSPQRNEGMVWMDEPCEVLDGSELEARHPKFWEF